MTKEEKQKIEKLRLSGMKPADIARTLNISDSAVRSYIRRHPANFEKGRCKMCGKILIQTINKRDKIFCSSECKNLWWNRNRCLKKGCKVIICEACGKEFRGYENRKYCCRECYQASRQSGK